MSVLSRRRLLGLAASGAAVLACQPVPTPTPAAPPPTVASAPRPSAPAGTPAAGASPAGGPAAARPTVGESAPSKAPPGGARALRAATVYAYLGYLPVYAAIQRRHLAEVGLSLDIAEFKGGGDAGKAFVGGATDVLIASYDQTLKLREEGLDVVATANVEATYAYALMARKPTPYVTIESLKGKTIGTTGPGSSTDINIRYALKQRGLDAERDVTLLAVGGGAPMLAALDRDQIQAGMFLDPLLTQLLGQPDRYQVVHDFRNLEYPLLCVTMRRVWLGGKTGAARGLLAALVKAEVDLQQDPAVAPAVAREHFSDVPPDVLEAAVKSTLPRLSRDGRISETAHQNVLEQQLFAGVVAARLPYSQVVDLSYLPG